MRGERFKAIRGDGCHPDTANPNKLLQRQGDNDDKLACYSTSKPECLISFADGSVEYPDVPVKPHSLIQDDSFTLLTKKRAKHLALPNITKHQRKPKIVQTDVKKSLQFHTTMHYAVKFTSPKEPLHFHSNILNL